MNTKDSKQRTKEKKINQAQIIEAKRNNLINQRRSSKNDQDYKPISEDQAFTQNNNAQKLQKNSNQLHSNPNKLNNNLIVPRQKSRPKIVAVSANKYQKTYISDPNLAKKFLNLTSFQKQDNIQINSKNRTQLIKKKQTNLTEQQKSSIPHNNKCSTGNFSNQLKQNKNLSLRQHKIQQNQNNSSYKSPNLLEKLKPLLKILDLPDNLLQTDQSNIINIILQKLKKYQSPQKITQKTEQEKKKIQQDYISYINLQKILQKNLKFSFEIGDFNKIEKMQNQLQKYHKFNKLFQDSKILRQLEYQNKQFIFNLIYNFQKKNFQNIKLLYRKDALNPNFFQYLENQKNLIILFESEKEVKFGIITEKICQTFNQQSRGILFNLNKKKLFQGANYQKKIQCNQKNLHQSCHFENDKTTIYFGRKQLRLIQNNFNLKITLNNSINYFNIKRPQQLIQEEQSDVFLKNIQILSVKYI